MRRRKHAQGMTEYIIIVGLIAVGLIVAVGAFKEILRVTLAGGETSITGGVEGVGATIEEENDAEDPNNPNGTVTQPGG